MARWSGLQHVPGQPCVEFLQLPVKLYCSVRVSQRFKRAHGDFYLLNITVKSLPGEASGGSSPVPFSLENEKNRRTQA